MIGLRARRIDAAREALGQGDLQATHRLAASLLHDNAQDAEGHFLLGVTLAGAGQIAPGIASLERAVALDPQGEYRAQLAKLYAMVRREGDAAFVLEQAEAALPADALSRDTMGCVYARLGNHNAALGHFREAVRLQPYNSEYRYNLAVTLNFLAASTRPRPHLRR